MKRGVVARQICCVKDTFENADAVQRNILHVKYLNESCLSIEQEGNNLRVLSVTLLDGTVLLTSSHRSRCSAAIITLSTRVCIVYKRYHIGVTIDLNPSMFAVSLVPSYESDVPSYAVPFDRAIPCLKTLFKSLTQSLSVPVSGLCFAPSICVSVVANYLGKQTIILQAFKIRKETIDTIIEEIRQKLASITTGSNFENKTTGMVQSLGCALSAIRYTDPTASPCLILVTNGVVPQIQSCSGTTTNCLSTLVLLDIPLHFIFIPVLEELSGPLYSLSNPTMIQFAAATTRGTCVDLMFLRNVQAELNSRAPPKRRRKRRDSLNEENFVSTVDPSVANTCLTRFLIALLCRFSQVDEEHFRAVAPSISKRSTVKGLFDEPSPETQNMDDATIPFLSTKFFKIAAEPRVTKQATIQPLINIDYPYPWHGQPAPIPILVKDLMEYRVPVSWSTLIPLRIKGGFEIKQLIYDPYVVCIRLMFHFLPSVSLNYILKRSRENTVPGSIVIIRISAPSEFFREFLNAGVNSIAKHRQNTEMFKLHQFINGIYEVDRVFTHFHSPGDSWELFATACLGGFASEPLGRLARYFLIHSFDLITMNDGASVLQDIFAGWASFLAHTSSETHYFKILPYSEKGSQESEEFLPPSTECYVLGRLCLASGFLACLHLAFPYSSTRSMQESCIQDLYGEITKSLGNRVRIRAQTIKPIVELCGLSVPVQHLVSTGNLSSTQLTDNFLNSFFSYREWIWDVPDIAAGHDVVRGLIRSRIAEQYMIASASSDLLLPGTYEIKGPERSRLATSCHAAFCKPIAKYDPGLKCTDGTCLVQYRVSYIGDNKVHCEFWMENSSSFFQFAGEVLGVAEMRKEIESHIENSDSTIVAATITCFSIHTSDRSDLLLNWRARQNDEDPGKTSSSNKIQVSQRVAAVLLGGQSSTETLQTFKTRGNSNLSNKGFFEIFKESVGEMSDAILEVDNEEKRLVFVKVVDSNNIILVDLPLDHGSKETSGNNKWTSNSITITYFALDCQKLRVPTTNMSAVIQHCFGYSNSNTNLGADEDQQNKRKISLVEFKEQVHVARFHALGNFIHLLFASQFSHLSEEILNPEDIESILKDCPCATALVDTSLLRNVLCSALEEEDQSRMDVSLSEIDEQFNSILNEFFKPIPHTSFYYFIPGQLPMLLEDDTDDENDDESETRTKPDIRGLRRNTRQGSITTPSLDSEEPITQHSKRGEAPLFLRIQCVTRGTESDDTTTTHSENIVDGKICTSVMSTLKYRANDEVYVNLVFSTLSQTPQKQQSIGKADSNELVWLLTQAVRKKIRVKVKAMVTAAVLTALQKVYPLTSSTLTLVQQLLDRGSLPASRITRTNIQLTFVSQDLGPRIFSSIIEKSPFLSVVNVGPDVYCVVHNLNRDGNETRQYEIHYWAIISLRGSSVLLEFYHPRMFSDETISTILEFLTNGLHRIAHRANQLTLLQNLHDTRIASELLIDTQMEIENGAFLSGNAGRYACECLHKDTFEIPERLHISVAMHELRENALHPFVVTNMRDVYVYKDREGNVFYLKLLSESSRVELQVYGIESPSEEMKQVLHSLLGNKIVLATLNALSRLLNRNPQFKLQIYDTDFLFNGPRMSQKFAVPKEILDLALFLIILRQNLTTIVQQLYFASTPSNISIPRQQQKIQKDLLVYQQHPAFIGYVKSSDNVQATTANASPLFLGCNYISDNGGAETTYEMEVRREDFTFFYNSLKGDLDIGTGLGMSVISLTCQDEPVTTLRSLDESDSDDPNGCCYFENSISERYPRAGCIGTDKEELFVNVDLWNNGSIQLNKLMDSYSMAFDRAIYEYKFEMFYVEKPLLLLKDSRVEESSFGHLHSICNYIDNSSSSPSFSVSNIHFGPNLCFEDQQVLMHDVCKSVLSMQPEISLATLAETDGEYYEFAVPVTIPEPSFWCSSIKKWCLIATPKIHCIKIRKHPDTIISPQVQRRPLNDDKEFVTHFGAYSVSDMFRHPYVSITTKCGADKRGNPSQKEGLLRKRSIFMFAAISADQIAIHTYNWAPTKLNLLLSGIRTQVEWMATRIDLLRQIQYHRMALSFACDLLPGSVKFISDMLVNNKTLKGREAGIHVIRLLFENRSAPYAMIREILHPEEHFCKAKSDPVLPQPPRRHDVLATARAAMESRKRGISKPMYEKARSIRSVTSVGDSSSSASITGSVLSETVFMKAIFDFHSLLLAPGPIRHPIKDHEGIDPVCAFGLHALKETENYRVISNRSDAVLFLIARWGQNQNRYSFGNSALSRGTRLEVNELMNWSRLSFIVRAPTFLDEKEPIVEHLVGLISQSTDMGRIYLTGTPGSCSNEAFLQKVVRGVVLLLHLESKPGFVRCSLRVVEPNRNNSDLETRSEEMFMMQQNTSRPNGVPIYLQEISRIKMHINLVGLVFDFHVGYFHHRFHNNRDFSVAPSLVAFASMYKEIPPEANSSIYHQPFQFLIGGGLPKQHYGRFFNYVVHNAQLYGMQGIPCENSFQVLFISSSNGTFPNSVQSEASSRYNVVIRHISDNEENGNLLLDVIVSSGTFETQFASSSKGDTTIHSSTTQFPCDDKYFSASYSLPSQVDTSQIYSLEETVDNLDMYLHEVFSNAVIRYQRNLVWFGLQQLSLGIGSPIIDANEFLDLSFHCTIDKLDISLEELLNQSLSWSDFKLFAETAYDKLALKDVSTSDILVLLPDSRMYGESLDVALHLDFSNSGAPMIHVCFRNPLSVSSNITCTRLFVTDFVHKMMNWGWNLIEHFRIPISS